jgi:hypothetical protein
MHGRAILRLIGFHRVELQPGESRTLTIRAELSIGGEAHIAAFHGPLGNANVTPLPHRR